MTDKEKVEALHRTLEQISHIAELYLPVSPPKEVIIAMCRNAIDNTKAKVTMPVEG